MGRASGRTGASDRRRGSCRRYRSVSGTLYRHRTLPESFAPPAIHLGCHRLGVGRRASVSVESLRIASILVPEPGARRVLIRSTQFLEHPKSPGSGSWLAHTLYTTNFDEVIPQTLRYCGEPVVIVDHPGAHGRLQGPANYPRVAYLHGCHLYYSLRNTAAELGRADIDRSGGVDIAGLFLRFRDVLRSHRTDRAGTPRGSAVVADPGRLRGRAVSPLWGLLGERVGVRRVFRTRRCSCSATIRTARACSTRRSTPRPRQTLCSGLGVPYEENLARWSARFSRVHTQFEQFAVCRCRPAHRTRSPRASATRPDSGRRSRKSITPAVTSLTPSGHARIVEPGPARWSNASMAGRTCPLSQVFQDRMRSSGRPAGLEDLRATYSSRSPGQSTVPPPC